MIVKVALAAAQSFVLTLACSAQENSASKPPELEALSGAVGTWDAKIEVWPQGLDSPSIKFQGVEEIRPYGEYWIASEFDSEYEGQTIGVHSIVGYDLDKQQLVGMVIDHGPYAASMTGVYDAKTKAVTWTTHAKDAGGKPMVQTTTVTQTNADQRVLTLSVPGDNKEEFVKFMEITFSKRE